MPHTQAINFICAQNNNSMLFQYGVKSGCIGFPERSYVSFQHDYFPGCFEDTQYSRYFSRVLKFHLTHGLQKQVCVRRNAIIYWDELLTWLFTFFPRTGTVRYLRPPCLERLLSKCPNHSDSFSLLLVNEIISNLGSTCRTTNVKKKHEGKEEWHETFSGTVPTLGHKTSFNKFKTTEIILSIFSNHNALKLKMNCKRKLEKPQMYD